MSDPASKQFLASYTAATTGSGSVALRDWSVVSLAGDDRTKFLHNMCTNDIVRLAPGESCEAFCTDVKGKIIAHTIVLVQEEQLELLAAPRQAERIIAHLDRYIIREDVVLEDRTKENRWSLILGEKGGEVLSTGRTAFGTHLLGAESYLVRASGSELKKSLPGICPIVDESIWNALRIESAFPLFGTDFDGSHLPQEIARDDRAISFNKGCYLGQETVARIDALGHVNKQICSLRFMGSEVPQVGAQLKSGEKEVGEVTSACWSPRHEAPLALAMLRRGANSVGNELESEFGPATVVPSR